MSEEKFNVEALKKKEEQLAHTKTISEYLEKGWYVPEILKEPKNMGFESRNLRLYEKLLKDGYNVQPVFKEGTIIITHLIVSA